MGKLVTRFTADQRGAATMEYGLIAAGLSVAIVTLLHGIGMRLTLHFAESRSSSRLGR